MRNEAERNEQNIKMPHGDMSGGSSSGYCEPPLGSSQEDTGDLDPE